VIAVGLPLHPNLLYLERMGPLLETVDLFEICPETTWRTDAAGALVPNDYARLFAALGQRIGVPFIAHGTGFSVGSAGDEVRQARWCARMREDQQTFAYRWWTDHLGQSVFGDEIAALPLPLPMNSASIAAVRGALAAMRAVVPRVGVENTAHHFVFGEPLDEPAFIEACVGDDYLLLDLHNVVAMAENLGFEPARYLDRLDLSRVIELHVAGGTPSAPSWLPSGRTLRLDGHDAPIPEGVWALLTAVLPRCANLQAVILERMEGTVAPTDVPLLREELGRLRRAVA
jgi:uncharacterized protein